jgi:hypothetical protein
VQKPIDCSGYCALNPVNGVGTDGARAANNWKFGFSLRINMAPGQLRQKLKNDCAVFGRTQFAQNGISGASA